MQRDLNPMLDNICSLPLTSDLFAQAIHPYNPILSVGLSTGHVETFRLPALDSLTPATGEPNRPNVNAQGRRLSENGFDTVDSVWRTRRHKGSCRTLAYSLDGEMLYSAGTDGLIKAAAAENGQVLAKVALDQIFTQDTPNLDTPSILRTLSPQALLLGTDSGSVRVYDLREPASSPSSRPSQAFRPHATSEDPSLSEAISSLTPLPPTSASTSGASRSWVSTSGSTFSVTDLRKGVVVVSEDQGDVLMSSVCLPAPTLQPNASVGSVDAMDRIIVGGMSGAIMMWDRGKWTDRIARYAVGEGKGRVGDDQEVEELAVVPEAVIYQCGMYKHSTVAAAMSNGRISFTKIKGHKATPIGEVYHEYGSVDGITALGFDVAGRMISGGGRLVKIWRQKSIETEDNDDEPPGAVAEGSDDPPKSDSDSSSDSESDVEKSKQKPMKRRKRGHGSEKHGHHGVMAFDGMD